MKLSAVVLVQVVYCSLMVTVCLSRPEEIRKAKMAQVGVDVGVGPVQVGVGPNGVNVGVNTPGGPSGPGVGVNVGVGGGTPGGATPGGATPSGPGVGVNVGVSGGAGGSTYIRWGATDCPSTAQTLYSGKAGGTHTGHPGSGANYLCMPDETPQYFGSDNNVTPGVVAFVYGAEYHLPVRTGRHDTNVPCAMCYVPNRSAKLVKPASFTCPQGWTEEYRGYLMANFYAHAATSMYVCVDQELGSLPNSGISTDGALFAHAASACSLEGFPCAPQGPYQRTRALTCVVCTN